MRKILVFLILSTAALIAGCGDKTADGGGDVLARVGGVAITSADFDTEFNRIPPFQRKEFENPEGKRKLLDRLIEMRLLYLAAVDAGLESDSTVAAEQEKAREQILLRHYYTTRIEAEAVPDEAAIAAHYDENREDFAVKARVRARMALLADRDAAADAARRVRGGESLEMLARNESKDGPTAAEDGDLGWFSTDGYIRSIGVNPEFASAVFAQETGAVGDPIEIAGKGWAVVRVEEREDAHQKTLEEVRDEIGRRLGPRYKETFFKQRIEELKSRFGAEYVREDYEANDVLVTIGESRIDSDDLLAELQRIPPFQRREYETVEGKRNVVERLVEMKLMYLAAAADKMESEPEVEEEFARAGEQILMREYFRQHIEEKAAPSEELIAEYYDKNPSEFEMRARVHARMILTDDRAAAVAAAARVEGGEPFEDVARDASRDAATAQNGGDLDWFTADGYVRSIGADAGFTAAVFAQAVGELGAPIEVEGKGWAVVQVTEKQPAHKKSLDEAREEINRRLAPKARQTFFKDSIEALKSRFEVEYVREDFGRASSPEELFELAQNTQDSHERIGYYEQIVERFRDNEQADRAQFMIGFVYSEELRDKEAARAAFERFIELFPGSDLVEDARYMLDAIDGREPEFETTDD